MRKSYKIFIGIAAVAVVGALAVGNSGLYKGSLGDLPSKKQSSKCDVLFNQCSGIRIGGIGKNEKNTIACAKYEEMCKAQFPKELIRASTPTRRDLPTSLPRIEALSSRGIGNKILPSSLQAVGDFMVTAPSDAGITLTSLSVLCVGSGAVNTELPDNAMEINNSIFAASSPENSAMCNTGIGRTLTFTPPAAIPAGTSKNITVWMDTNADPGQWSTGESMNIRINGSRSIYDNIAGGLAWYYTDYGLSTASNLSSSYPVDGPTLVY